MTLQEDCVLGQRELIRRVPDGDGLARAADALNAARLIERERRRRLRRCQRGEPSVRSPDHQERSSNDSVRVSMHEMVVRIPAQNVQTGGGVRTRENLRQEGFRRLRHPRNVADDDRASRHAVQ